MKILEENTCQIACDCGWNITIGGTSKKKQNPMNEDERKEAMEGMECWHCDNHLNICSNHQVDATLAERERCAEIARSLGEEGKEVTNLEAEYIAKAIEDHE